MPSTSDYKIKHDELQILINSRTPIITVETSEEDRLEKLLLAIATQMAVPFSGSGPNLAPSRQTEQIEIPFLTLAAPALTL